MTISRRQFLKGFATGAALAAVLPMAKLLPAVDPLFADTPFDLSPGAVNYYKGQWQGINFIERGAIISTAKGLYRCEVSGECVGNVWGMLSEHQ